MLLEEDEESKKLREESAKTQQRWAQLIAR